MKDGVLRLIDLGRCTAREYFAASDVPALSSDDTAILVFGVISDENFCLGFNRTWEKTMTHLPPGFTRARFTTEGGLMYCRDVGVMRVWTPDWRADPFDLQSLLTNATVRELRARVDRDLPIDYETKYACLAGDKFAGGSHNLINARSAGLIMINKDRIDFDSVRHLFRSKRLQAVRDLSEFDLPPSFYDGIIARVAAAAECEVSPSSWTDEEAEHLAALSVAHSDPQWIEEARMDLFEFREFYDDDVYN